MQKGTVVLGAVVAGGVAYYFWRRHVQAQSQIIAQPVVQPVPGTSAALPPVPSYAAPVPEVTAPVPAPVPPAPSQTSQPTVAQMAGALIDQWANSCKNPTIMIQMIGLLTDEEVAGLYNILTSQWETGGQATRANTAFWNHLRDIYPCLNSQGVGCSSPTSCP